MRGDIDQKCFPCITCAGSILWDEDVTIYVQATLCLPPRQSSITALLREALSKELGEGFLAMSPGAAGTLCQSESEPEHQQPHNLHWTIMFNISSIQPQNLFFCYFFDITPHCRRKNQPGSQLIYTGAEMQIIPHLQATLRRQNTAQRMAGPPVIPCVLYFAELRPTHVAQLSTALPQHQICKHKHEIWPHSVGGFHLLDASHFVCTVHAIKHALSLGLTRLLFGNNATAVGQAAERVQRGWVTAWQGCTALQFNELGPELNMQREVKGIGLL